MKAELATRVALVALVLAIAPGARAGDEAVPPAIADRLGRPVQLAMLRGSMRPVARDLVQLLRATYRVEAGRVPVYVLDRKALNQVDAILSRRPVRHNRLRGLEYRGVIYVDVQHPEVRETLTHELLHAMSRRFSGEAGRLGHHKLVEGMTQYLTLKTGIGDQLKQAGIRRRGTAYGMYLRFAERLADVVGDELLAECFFRGGYGMLERSIDRALGRGRLARALAYLKQDDLGAAFKALGAEASHPFDGVFTNY